MTLTEDRVYPAVSFVLAPEFVEDLQKTAISYDKNQEGSDDDKWAIATAVNGWWDEHKSSFADKRQYFEECSRVANIGLRKKRFSDSGETLRAWCQLQETYSNFPKCDELLTHFTFEHLRIAKSLALRELVSSPIEALNRTMVEKWTAQEMEEHYAPKLPVHPYDNLKSWLTGLMKPETWSFMKAKEDLDYVKVRLDEIQRKIAEVLNKEGKHE